jgi:hypothetical protein
MGRVTVDAVLEKVALALATRTTPS